MYTLPDENVNRVSTSPLVQEILFSGKVDRVAQHLALQIAMHLDPETGAVRFSGRELAVLSGWGKTAVAEHLAELKKVFNIAWGDGSGGSVFMAPWADPCVISIERSKAALREAVIQEFGHVCSHCGWMGDDVCGPDGDWWHMDRILPGLYGGKYEPTNVTLSCATCNISRGAKNPGHVFALSDWRKLARDWPSSGTGEAE